MLAGGRGTRLAPLTDTLPKAMAPVAGRPFLWHLLRRLGEAGVREAVLLVGYRAPQIREYFGTGRELGLRLIYLDDGGRPLGTGGAVRAAEPLLAERFLLLYGDTYWPVPYGRLLRRAAEPDVLAVMGVRAAGGGDGQPANVALNGTRVLLYDKGGAAPALTHLDAGASGVCRSALALLPADRPCALETDLFPALAARGLLGAWPRRTAFHDIGTPERLARFERFLASGRGAGTASPDRHAPGSARTRDEGM